MRLLLLLSLLPCLVCAQTKRKPELVPSVAAQMFEQLQSGDWRNWIAKAEALDYFARYEVPDTVAPVKAVLENTHPNYRWLRGRALIALARIDPKNAATLAETYSKDPHLEVRAAAAEICAELPAPKAAPIIERLLAEKTPFIQFHALAADAHHRGVASWNRADTMTAKAVPADCIEPAAQALARIGTEAAATRLLLLAKQTKSLPALLRGLEGTVAPALVSFYIELIPIVQNRVSVADVWRALSAYDRKVIVATFREALISGDDEKVHTVASLMARYLREPELGENLKVAIAKTENRDTLIVGLSALSCVEADRFKEVFLARLSHKDKQVRVVAVQCLAQCKEVNLYQALEKTLSDSDPLVTNAVLQVLLSAPAEQAPRNRIVEYFTHSLLSTSASTRQAATLAIAPNITRENGEAALDVMRKMQSQFGTDGTAPLMKAVFRMVPEDQSAKILEAHGYVAQWHVIGAFPAGFGAPKEDVDGFKMVYPPEKKVDLNESIMVAYNKKSRTHDLAKNPQSRRSTGSSARWQMRMARFT